MALQGGDTSSPRIARGELKQIQGADRFERTDSDRSTAASAPSSPVRKRQDKERDLRELCVSVEDALRSNDPGVEFKCVSVNGVCFPIGVGQLRKLEHTLGSIGERLSGLAGEGAPVGDLGSYLSRASSCDTGFSRTSTCGVISCAEDVAYAKAIMAVCGSAASGGGHCCGDAPNEPD